MIPAIIGLAHRINTSAIDVIATLDTTRFEALINSTQDANMTSGYNLSEVGNAVGNVAGYYTDALGMTAYIIFFSIPFIYSWFSHSDLLPAGIFGLFFAAFAYGYLPSNYFFVAIVFALISVVSVVWSLYQKRG